MNIELVFAAISIVISITLHEFTHAKVADMAGDPTPRSQGRVTLNPIAHFDLMGAVMIAVTLVSGFGIGWGKPVMVDPSKMRNPKWDHFWSVLAAPLVNLTLALIGAILIRLVLIGGVQSESIIMFLLYFTLINVGLFSFNMLPIGPLDGMWIVGTFFKPEARRKWTKWNLTTGTFVFLLAVILPIYEGRSVVDLVLEPARMFLFRILLP